MKGNFSVFFILVLLLAATAYLDSPYSFLNKKYTFAASEPVTAAPINELPSSKVPEIVEKLEERTKEDGYIVETYREYEVYKDGDGNVTKSVPTSKTDTLKYWDYSKNDR